MYLYRALSSNSSFGCVRFVSCPLFNVSFPCCSWLALALIFSPCSTLAVTPICFGPKIFRSSPSSCTKNLLYHNWMKVRAKDLVICVVEMVKFAYFWTLPVKPLWTDYPFSLIWNLDLNFINLINFEKT